MSDPDIHHPPPETHSPPAITLRSAAITIPHKTDDNDNESNEMDGTGMHLRNNFHTCIFGYLLNSYNNYV